MSHHVIRIAICLSLRQLDELDHLRCESGLTRDQYLVESILHLLKPEPHLNRIKIQFHRKGQHHMPTPGPITLTTAGQTATASVVGFDQFGQPFTGEIPTPTFSSDDTSASIVTFDPSTGVTTAVANGVANITATVTTTDSQGNNVTLTDTEAVTVSIAVVPPPAPVLSSIKVAFAQ